MAGKNYLFGFGERLTHQIPAPRTPHEKVHPYSIAEALHNLNGQLLSAVETADGLDDILCPNNEIVMPITLHPGYLAKSYFPKNFLATFDFRVVGSRPAKISPKKAVQKKPLELYPTTTLFVAGNRNSFFEWSNIVTGLDQQKVVDEITDDTDFKWLEDLRKLEQIRYFQEGERIRETPFPHSNESLYEVVLHYSNTTEETTILNEFSQLCKQLGASLHLNRGMFVQGLYFVPLIANSEQVKALESFAFVRLIRRMPMLRVQSRGKKASRRGVEYDIPNGSVVDPSIKAAIFDAGLPSVSPLAEWINYQDLTGCKEPDEDDIFHGEAVTSAFLMGPIEEGKATSVPFSKVDHFKIYDYYKDANEDLYDVLDRIKNVLSTRTYDFVNFSVSPAIPIEDDEIHLWTATLDELFSSGQTLATIAAGNSGQMDWDSGNARVQVPGDCVNALTVGAANSTASAVWARANYSSIGPGRSPGFTKPEVVAFGGVKGTEPFYFVESGTFPYASEIEGTSLASPLALRTAAGMRANLGTQITPLTCKALLIHHADAGGYPTNEVGHGRIPLDVDTMLTSDDSTAKIIYQGNLDPSKYLRARIPMISSLPGLVEIKATFCFTCEPSVNEPSNYTKSGLDIVFRPDMLDIEPEAKNPVSESFFGKLKGFATEAELRADAKKWETVLNASVRKQGRNLHEPVFDIHYIARDGSADAVNPKKIPFSLVITVRAPKVKDLYNQLAVKYRNELQIMTPVRVQVKK